MASSTPFLKRPLEPDGLMDKLLRRPNPQNALIELENALAAGVLEVSEEDLQRITETHQVDLSREYRAEQETLYVTFLEHCIGDAEITLDEQAAINHLCLLLGIDDDRAQELEQPVRQDAYRRVVEERMRDRRLDEREREELDQRRRILNLTEEQATEMHQQVADSVVRDYLNMAVEDAQLSPDEVAEVETAVESLNLDFQLSAEQQQRWDRYRLYWDLEHGELPVASVDINLQRAEVPHVVTPAAWYERRSRTRTIRYSGPGARIRIAKGIYWRAGSVDVQRVTEEVMQHIDNVVVYLTSKRAILVGQGRTSNIRLNRILDFTPYSDGVEIVKDSGRNPVLLFDQDIDIFCLTLDRLLRELSA